MDFTPQDWTELETCHDNAYRRSKLLAEKKAWEF